MFSERRVSIFQSVVGNPTSPYLRLRVKRDRIIEDALVEVCFSSSLHFYEKFFYEFYKNNIVTR
jgi:hypothetical protein